MIYFVSAAGQPNQPSIMTSPPSPVSYCGLGPSLTPHGPPSLTLPPTPAVFVPERVWQDCIMNPEYTSQVCKVLKYLQLIVNSLV